jgi:hypothetical protein
MRYYDPHIEEQMRQRYEEELIREFQEEEDSAIELCPESAIIRISDGSLSPEFQAQAKERIESCCSTDRRPERRPVAKFEEPTANDWPYPW